MPPDVSTPRSVADSEHVVIGYAAKQNSIDGDTLGFDSREYLIGGSANDRLVGGSNFDYMAGGMGNDTYEVNDIEDVVLEAAGQGNNDRIITAVSYTLPTGVEDLTLAEDTGLGYFDENLDGTGNALVNVITGNDGNNVLRGLDGDDPLDGKVGGWAWSR
jgi:Ca2+-binding RTX toxin-like protein